jgi:predicted O-methyltransferase YrrM
MDIVDPAIERYMEQLTRADDEPVLLEMEALAKEKGFPIIGRLCGRSLEILARSIGAKRIFELGSGYGYSAYWFSRATGPDGEIHLSDGDERNKESALDFLERAGLAEPIWFHVGDALSSFASVEGEFDIVYCDVDKGGYPDCWAAARNRVRVGGYYICDNMLWSGRVTGETDDEDVRPGWTAAIDATNRAIFSDPDYRAWINPTRDGVVIALRIR